MLSSSPQSSFPVSTTLPMNVPPSGNTNIGKGSRRNEYFTHSNASVACPTRNCKRCGLVDTGAPAGPRASGGDLSAEERSAAGASSPVIRLELCLSLFAEYRRLQTLISFRADWPRRDQTRIRDLEVVVDVANESSLCEQVYPSAARAFSA